MMKRKITRKQFLRGTAQAITAATLANGPLSILFDSILKTSLRAAYGDVRPRRWVDLRLDNAPPRFVFDLFLQNQISDRANFVANDNHIFTKFVASNNVYGNGVYETTQMSTALRSVCAPHLWTQNVPAAGGGVRPLADLLRHFLHLRGINTGNPGHSGSMMNRYRPLGAGQSIAALSGDRSPAPIAAVVYAASGFTFRSNNSNSPTLLSGNDLVASLLSPFSPSFTTAMVAAREAQVKTYLDAARATMRSQASTRHPDSAAIEKTISGARELMGSSLADLRAQWPTLLAKYNSLITRSLAMALPGSANPIAGITDKPVGIDPASRVAGGQYDLSSSLVYNPDLRTLFEGAGISKLAQSFAITEFILMNNLSDSVTATIGEFTNLNLILTANGPTVRGVASFDEHTTGAMISTLLNAVHSIATGACLLELIDRMQASGQWANTVINMSGEFNRKARTNGMGSDHLDTGASAAIYSGIIDGPHILGDIASNAEPLNYKGTNGYGVIQNSVALDNSLVDLGNLAATIAQLLGVPSPVTARETLLFVRGNTLIPRLPPGKIVTLM